MYVVDNEIDRHANGSQEAENPESHDDRRNISG
jgi:hypothetical protein